MHVKEKREGPQAVPQPQRPLGLCLGVATFCLQVVVWLRACHPTSGLSLASLLCKTLWSIQDPGNGCHRASGKDSF